MNNCKICSGLGCLECEPIEPMAYYDENGCIHKNKVTLIKEDNIKLTGVSEMSDGSIGIEYEEVGYLAKINYPDDLITINPDGETYNIKAANGVILEVPKANELKDMFEGMLNKVTVIKEYNTDFIGFKDNPLSNVTSNISVEIPIHLVKPIELLLKEYKSACEKHPVFPSSKFEQFAILSEEVHEYNKEIQNDAHECTIGTNTITELAQIGAVVLRMVEHYQNK